MTEKDNKYTGEHEIDYGRLIAERISRISNKKFLQFMYRLLESFALKWGVF
ncbi:MAG: hypothetical protein K1W13_03690 [Lachnospiraceae bacterium]